MKRILAFEGDETLAAQLKAFLWRKGCALDVVDDADAGIEQALEDRPDLILLSIELPKVNGFSVCSRLKRNKTLRSVPLIVLSSECTDETFENHKKMESRAEAYFSKPVDLELLFEEIRRLLDLQVAAPGQIAAQRPLITDDDEDRSTGRAPITAIVQSIDGAFQEIQEPEEPEETEETIVVEGLPSDDDEIETPSTDPDQQPARHPAAPRREPCLLGLWSPDARVRGQCFGFSRSNVVGHARISAGRDEQNTVVVDDPAVADDHFLLERTDEGIALRDLGSGLGTYVNDELLSHHVLRGGEVIRFGETTLLFLQDLDLDSQFDSVVRELSEVDQLTRTLTHRAVRERLEVELFTANQELTSLSVAAVGVDELRKLAYRYGDVVAERVLAEVAALLKSKSGGGVVGRDLCGDFLVVMPAATERMAVASAEGWRFEASVSEVLTEAHSVKFTVSVGVVELREGWSTADLLRRAYRLLWEAQLAGGNRVASRGNHVSAV